MVNKLSLRKMRGTYFWTKLVNGKPRTNPSLLTMPVSIMEA